MCVCVCAHVCACARAHVCSCTGGLSPWCILYQQPLPAEPQRQARAKVCLHGHVCEELPRLAVIVLREDGFQLALAPRVRPWVLVHSLGQAVLLLHSLQFRPRGL